MADKIKTCKTCAACMILSVIIMIVAIFFIENCTAGGGVIQCAMPKANTQGL